MSFAMANDYRSKGIGFVAMSSNDITTHPEDAPDKMADLAQSKAFPFPYLYDESQSTAKAYEAACTPDFYLFDSDLLCVYRGQMDDSRPQSDIPVSGSDLRAALDAVLAGKPVTIRQYFDLRELGPCHLLFIGETDEETLSRILAHTRERAILTVSDREGSAEKGVLVNLELVESRVQLVVNESAVRESGLRMSHLLLGMARIVSPVRGRP